MSFTDNRCFSLWGDSNIGWVHSEGDNGAGSMLSMWHKDKFCYDSHVVGIGFIAVVNISNLVVCALWLISMRPATTVQKSLYGKL